MIIIPVLLQCDNCGIFKDTVMQHLNGKVKTPVGWGIITFMPGLLTEPRPTLHFCSKRCKQTYVATNKEFEMK